MIFLGYFATFISLIGIILNARKNIWCWPIWIGSNLLWIIYSLIEGDIPSVVLWSMFTFANIYGWKVWKQSKN